MCNILHFKYIQLWPHLHSWKIPAEGRVGTQKHLPVKCYILHFKYILYIFGNICIVRRYLLRAGLTCQRQKWHSFFVFTYLRHTIHYLIFHHSLPLIAEKSAEQKQANSVSQKTRRCTTSNVMNAINTKQKIMNNIQQHLSITYVQKVQKLHIMDHSVGRLPGI